MDRLRTRWMPSVKTLLATLILIELLLWMPLAVAQGRGGVLASG